MVIIDGLGNEISIHRHSNLGFNFENFNSDANTTYKQYLISVLMKAHHNNMVRVTYMGRVWWIESQELKIRRRYRIPQNLWDWSVREGIISCRYFMVIVSNNLTEFDIRESVDG